MKANNAWTNTLFSYKRHIHVRYLTFLSCLSQKPRTRAYSTAVQPNPSVKSKFALIFKLEAISTDMAFRAFSHQLMGTDFGHAMSFMRRCALDLFFVVLPYSKVFGFGVELVGNHFFIAHDPCIVAGCEDVGLSRIHSNF